MKEKTSIDYLSRLKMLETFIQECKNIKYAYQIDRAFAIDFLDHLMYDHEVLVTTRNNRFKRVAYFIFFTFQLQFLFVDFNLALIYSFYHRCVLQFFDIVLDYNLVVIVLLSFLGL